MRPRSWTDEEWQDVKSLLGQGFRVGAIAKMIGRHPHEISSKKQWEALAIERRASVSRERPFFRPPEELEADRNARARASRSLTAIICGDPPPGWSALDQKYGAST